MNLNKLMKQAQQMQAQMAKTQAELEEKTVEVTAATPLIETTNASQGQLLDDQKLAELPNIGRNLGTLASN